MRVLVAITVFLPSRIYGGPATVAMNQAKELVKHGHEVTVITSNVLTMRPRRHCDEQNTVIAGVRILYFPTYILVSRFPALVSFKLRRWVRESIQDFDVVHVHFARDWIPVVVASEAVRRGIRLFLQTHGMLGRRDGVRRIIDKFLIRRLLERASGVLTLQNVEEDSITAICPHAKTFIVPNGVTMEAARRIWSMNSLSRRTVLFLARLHPQKRVIAFIDAVKIIVESGHKIHGRIVGPDEGDLGHAQQHVKENGLGGIIEFVGAVPQDRVGAELVNTSVYVLPTLVEAFPMTVLEAMALGVPTIVTSGIHISEVLDQHEAALVVEPDAQSIAKGIEKILGNPDLAMRLSRKGRELIESKLTIDKVVSRLESIYQSG